MFLNFFVPVLLAVSSAVTPVSSLPTPQSSSPPSTSPQGSCDNSTVLNVTSLNDTATRFPELAVLASGNQAFLSAVNSSSNPNLLQDLATNGHHPDYLFLGCSDSRVSEGTIFSAQPGTLFSQRNFGNQFQLTDNNAASVLSYGVQTLGVGHVIVMGHYGCGGVMAAMSPWPNTDNDTMGCSVQSWIDPIRAVFANSSRQEIVSFRAANENNSTATPLGIDDPAFRALVEENVKNSVTNVVNSPQMAQHWGDYAAQNNGSSTAYRRDNGSVPLNPVYVHGFVYDIATGEISDLGVSTGPNGPTSEAPPPNAVKRAVDDLARGHVH